MNILFLYDHPLRPESGGTSRASSLVMMELERRGHKCFGHLHFDQDDTNLIYYNENRIESLCQFLTHYKIDVVVNQIAYSSWLLQAFYLHGGNEWKEKGGRVISFMHFDPTPAPFYLDDWLGDFWKRSLMGKIKRLALVTMLPLYLKRWERATKEGYKYVYEHSDFYVVMSPSYIDAFCQRTGVVDKSKFRVITNMLTFPEIAQPSIVEDKEKVVLVVARLDEREKRISRILHTWKNIKDHQGYVLRIIGSGEDESLYKQMIKTRNIQDVELLGQQSPLPFYQTASILLMSSAREGWGLCLTEAMQNGTVPVALNTSKVFADIIEDGKDGFLCNDRGSFRRSIEKLMTNVALRKEMGVTALQHSAKFSSEVVGQQWEDVLKEFTA